MSASKKPERNGPTLHPDGILGRRVAERQREQEALARMFATADECEVPGAAHGTPNEDTGVDDSPPEAHGETPAEGSSLTAAQSTDGSIVSIKVDTRTYEAPNVTAAIARMSGRTPASPPTSRPAPTSTSAASFTIPVGTRTAWVDPVALDEHPLARRYFDLGTEDEALDLVESVRGRTYKRLLVTGERCSGPSGTVLDGRRLRRAAMQAGVQVEIEYLDDLDADQELEVILHANIAAGLARRMTERRKAELEHVLFEIHGRRQGQRTDLTSAEIRGSGGETRQLVAKEMGESRNAVDDRHVIFFSPVSAELIKQHVDAGTIKRSAAAKLIRDAQQEPEIAAVLKEARATGVPFEQLSSHPVVVQAKTKVCTATEKLVGKKKRKKPKPKPVMAEEAWGVLVAGEVALNILAKKLLVEIDGNKVHAVVVGAADSDPTVYVPLAPTTRLSWVVDVQAAVDLLPGELRAQVAVGDVEVLDPVRCPTCGGTRFYRAGGCVKCRPLYDYAGKVSEIEDAEWRFRQALYNQLDRSAQAWRRARGYAGRALEEAKAEDEGILMVARKAWEQQYDEAIRARQPEVDAALDAATAADPRLRSPYRWKSVNLRYPRTRVVLRTPCGELAVTLWESACDSAASQTERSPAVVVGNDGYAVVLNRTGSFASDSAARPWNHCRSALRAEVHQALKRLLGRQPPPSVRESRSNDDAASDATGPEGSSLSESATDAGEQAATRVVSLDRAIVECAVPERVHLPMAADPFGRAIEDGFVRKEVERGAWRPLVVAPEMSGITRPMTIFLSKRKTHLIKWAWHGDEETFCPPTWADIAIGSGACGYGCRSCFLMLTWRAMRDPLMPVVYDNGDDFERVVRRWLVARAWDVEGKGNRARTPKDAIGLGIDRADSLLWEGATGHARRLIPLFTAPETNPLANPLILLTKSANTHYLGEIPDSALHRVDGRVPNVAVTMSLNPEPIADLWEGKFPDTMQRITPPIGERLEALRAAQDMGFEVRARIDPIMTPVGWREMYADFFADMARIGLRPTMLTLGSHREKMPQLDTFREKWGLPAMEWEAPKTRGREGTHVHMAGREEVYRDVRDIIIRACAGTGHSPWISLCKETHEVRRDVGLCNANCNCLPQSDAPRRRLELYPGTAQGT